MGNFAAEIRDSAPHVLAISGELDLAVAQQFLEHACAALANPTKMLNVDCIGLTFIDSSGLGSLVRISQEASALGAAVELTQVPHQMAGHPPPVLLTDAGPTFVEVSPGRPLGTGIAPYHSTTITIPRGSTLFCYTDGLVERRGEDIDVGLDRLATVLAGAAERSVEELVEHALHTLRHDDASDDIATLAIRWTEGR